VDLQREEFYGRIERIEDERSHQPRRPRRDGRKLSSGNWIAPIAMVLAAIVVMKAIVHANVGPEGYEYRLAALAEGDVADRVGAWVLAADPVTVTLSALLRDFVD